MEDKLPVRMVLLPVQMVLRGHCTAGLSAVGLPRNDEARYQTEAERSTRRRYATNQRRVAIGKGEARQPRSGGVSVRRVLLSRLVGALIVVFLVSLIVFALVRLMPGNAADIVAGNAATPGQIARVRAELGLDRPAVVQYLTWISGVIHGNLGTSLMGLGAVSQNILSRLPITLSLAIGGTLISVLIGVALGTLSALRLGTGFDRAVTLFSSASMSLPDFWVAIILVIVFAFGLHLFPATGYVGPSTNVFLWLHSVALPCFALGIPASAVVARQTRAEMARVLATPYIRTARAKGLPRRVVIVRHALRQAATSVVTVVGFQFSVLIGGALIVEQVFNLPGLGSLAITAVNERDVPMILGVVLFVSVMVVTVNLAVDLLYPLLDPRVRPR